MLSFFFFNDTATTEIYTLSLTRRSSDLLPLPKVLTCSTDLVNPHRVHHPLCHAMLAQVVTKSERDRKSTRLNSSHLGISYAVFCLKKKKSIPQWLIPYTRRSCVPMQHAY